MNVYEKTQYLAQTAAAGANFTSNSYMLGGIQHFSIQIGFSSATLNGTLTMECSNDLTLGFVTIAGTSTAVVSGASQVYNVSFGNYKYVRVKWAFTSGTGTLDAVLVIKAEIS